MSEYNQLSFTGGMNLLLDDTRLQHNQYRLAFNCRNRYDVLDPVNKSSVDTIAPSGIKQGVLTFGNYVILFVSGKAFYRAYDGKGWTQINGFSMSSTAQRFWTCTVPVATTNYGRMGVARSTQYAQNASANYGVVNVQNLVSSSGGNLPGLLVQDNETQPSFIYINASGYPIAKRTQNLAQWNASYDKNTGNLTLDNREYVPIGNAMAFVDGILYIASQDGASIYRSVSGRPLDFVINVNVDGSKGGDATDTAYSVGAVGITVLRAMNDGSLFVAAQNANFMVSKNMTQNSPTIFGEYTFIRRYLFEATCVSDRAIIDSLGDTKFVDLTGVRSFNAVEQLQNEGRNSVFTSTIASALKGITQDIAAAILFDNYELYAINTIFGAVIAVYDTINNSWAAFDTTQTSGKKIKQFAKIEQGVLRLFAITEDNQFYTLYDPSQSYDTASFLSLGISANALYENNNVKLNNPKNEVKLTDFRCILNRITENSSITVQTFVNNRLSVNVPVISKDIAYKAPVNVYTGNIPDLNTQLTNAYFTFPNMEQGWKVSLLISWTGGGSLTQFSTNLLDFTPMNPLLSQTTVK